MELGNKLEDITSIMIIKNRYIFGCNHDNRNIPSSMSFERGLEIPIILCDDCCFVCDICLNKIKIKTYDKLELCEKCYSRVIKIAKY